MLLLQISSTGSVEMNDFWATVCTRAQQ